VVAFEIQQIARQFFLPQAIPPGVLPLEKRISMSKQHGDKARFHRIRKQNTRRRAMVDALRIKLAAAANPVAPKEIPAT
jgi:hypothetical protein